MVTIPRINTERLLLREPRRSDFEAFASVVMDPRRTSPPPADRRTAWRQFLSSSGTWIVDGIGWWAVEERETGAFVGSVGAFYREPPPGPNDADDLEIGWSLVAGLRGRGFATEAAAAMLAHVSETKKPPRVIAHIDHDNARSIRVAEKLGMRYEREVSFYEDRLRRYALDFA